MTIETKTTLDDKSYRLPIPDFNKLGDGEMRASEAHEIFSDLLEMGRKRGVKVDRFEELIENYPTVDAYVLFRQFSDLFPHPERSLGMSDNLVDRAVANVFFDDDVDHVNQIRTENGGLSEYLKQESESERLRVAYSTRTTIEDPLFTELHETLYELAEIGGNQPRVDIIEDMLERLEHPWIFTRMLSRDVPMYVGDYMFLDAISQATGFDRSILTEAREVTNDGPLVFLDWAMDDRELATELTPHAKCGVMKAEYDYEPQDIDALQASGDWVAQTKYDGARIFVHHSGDGDIRAYLKGGGSDVTGVIPEINDIDWPDQSFIFDGEITPYDAETGEVKSFQNILRRISRGSTLDEDATPDLEVKFKLFDCLYWMGKDIRKQKFEDRFAVIQTQFLPPMIAQTGDDLEASFHRSLEEGHEGLVMKKLGHEYTLGTRSTDWQKWKAQPEELDVVVTDAHRGGGRISNGIGSLHIALEHDDEWINVGSVGTGFTDAERRHLLLEHEAGELVGQVIQVTFEELQHGGGSDTDNEDTHWALRFPSFDHKRPDGTVDTLTRAAELDGKADEFAEWAEAVADSDSDYLFS